MIKKAILMTVVAFTLLLAVIAAGLNAVFTVTYVKTNFLTFSPQGQEDAELLQKELDDGFVGKSTTFLHLTDVSAVVEKYPCFSLDSIEKKFPKTIELTVSERKESFTLKAGENNYAVFDSAGVYMHSHESNFSRTGGTNVLLEGFRLKYSEGQKAEGEYFDDLLVVFSVFEKELGIPRANIDSVSLVKGASESNKQADSFQIQTKEGVSIVIFDPSRRADEKASAVMKVYNSLSDSERLYGTIVAAVRGDNDFEAQWISGAVERH